MKRAGSFRQSSADKIAAMSYIEVTYPTEKREFYRMLDSQLRLYAESEPDITAAMANFSSVLAQAFSGVNWAGFYIVRGGELVLGPFQGRPAVTRIMYGRGVCGTSWQRREPIVVEEVECFEGHIACDCNTHSEIVIPIRDKSGEIWGVLDMDSVIPGYFTDEDRDGLTDMVKIIEEKLGGAV